MVNVVLVEKKKAQGKFDSHKIRTSPPLRSQTTQLIKLYIFYYDSIPWKFLGLFLEFVKVVSLIRTSRGTLFCSRGTLFCSRGTLSPPPGTGIFGFFEKKKPHIHDEKWKRLHFFFKNRPIFLTHPEQWHTSAKRGENFLGKNMTKPLPLLWIAFKHVYFSPKVSRKIHNLPIKILDFLPCAFLCFFSH